MRKLIAATAFLALLTSAGGAGAASLPEVGEERLSLKGITPGLSEAVVTGGISGLRCQKTQAVQSGARQCAGVAATLPEEFRTFGGAAVDVLIMFFGEDSKLGVALATIPSDSYTGLKVAMTERFGAPSNVEETAVQNKLGTKFANETVTWLKGDDKLMLQKFGSKINQGMLRLSSVAYEAARTDLTTKSKAKDF